MFKKILKLVIAILICQLAGVIGSIATFPSIPTWYAALNKPAFNPPNWIFGPVWTTLFTLMGIAAYLIWQVGYQYPKVKQALKIFALQLILNSFWSILFFGLQNPLAALIEILVLWATILTTIILFRRLSKVAGWLLIPYLLWVSFAAVLNLAIVVLN